VSTGGPPLRVAYLVSQYPALSHTFIEREIAALRAGGVEVSTFSVRPARGG
jgi:colanic acid/amylovoran biosynthesis glycosyltransferase